MPAFQSIHALCILCRTPSGVWCDFLQYFTRYKIYVMLDDESFNLTPFRIKYPRITFVSIPSVTCRRFHFLDMNFTVSKKITSWEKAMYYFSIEIAGRHPHTWFLEDDVFFHSESALVALDENYPNADLLSPPIEENTQGRKDYWHWCRIHVQLPPPYYFGMMCAVRLSNALLQRIQEYAARCKTLFFLEALFPTVAKHHQLSTAHPPELNKIYYRYGFTKDHVTSGSVSLLSLYHPVKNIEEHVVFRT